MKNADNNSQLKGSEEDQKRIKELEQQLRYAQIEVEYLKGLRRLGRKGQKAKLIHNLRKKFKLKEILTVTSFPKATYFYWKNRFNRANTDDLLENKLIEIRKCHANYGYRRMVQELRRNGWLVNHKKSSKVNEKVRAFSHFILA